MGKKTILWVIASFVIIFQIIIITNVKAFSTSSLVASIFGGDTAAPDPQVLGVETSKTTETEAILPSQKLSIKDKTLKETFPALGEGFKNISLGLESSSEAIKSNEIKKSYIIDKNDKGEGEYTLDSGLKVKSTYEEKKGIYSEEGHQKPVKQTITLNNPSDQDVATDVSIENVIDSDTIYWDGKEYEASEKLQTFKSYMGTEEIKPKEKTHGSDTSSGNNKKNNPKVLTPAYKGTAVSFQYEIEKDGEKVKQTGIYDFSDVANLDHELTLQKRDGQTFLTLTVKNVAVKAGGEAIIDPTYDFADDSTFSWRMDGPPADYSYLANRSLFTDDIDEDGKQDMIVEAHGVDSYAGSVWVIYGTILDDMNGSGNTIDLTDSSNFSLRFDGAAAANDLGAGGVKISDFDGDGKKDILIGTGQSKYSFYIINNSLFSGYTGTGNIIDLSDPSSYNVNFYSPTNCIRDDISVDDIDGDGKQDVLVGTHLWNYDEISPGSLYVLYGSMIDDYTSTGNNVDFTSSENFNLKFDGGNDYGMIGRNKPGITDLNGDGAKDLILRNCKSGIGVYEDIDHDGDQDYVRTDPFTCSIFIVYNNLFSNKSGKGNVIDASDSANYNIKYTGMVTDNEGDRMGIPDVSTEDIDNDGKKDLIIGTPHADNNSRADSGSAYLIYNTLFSTYAGTGNNLNINDSSSYNLRFDGASADDRFSRGGIEVSDIDGDGKKDVLIEAPQTGYNSRTLSGSVYIFNGSLLDDYTGTGNGLDLASSSSYSIRFDGAAANERLGRQLMDALDYNNDGINDLVLGSYSGAVYLIYGTKINGYTGIGNNVDTLSDESFNVRYNLTGVHWYYAYPGPVPTANDGSCSNKTDYSDLDGDGMMDLITGSFERSNYPGLTYSHSGSAWLIQNFPHAVGDNGLLSQVESTSPTITGTIEATTNSLTDISGVQYSVDSNNPSGTWNACIASDGAFDEKTEDYSCNPTNLSQGAHTIYIRAYDENTSYTAQSKYGVSPTVINNTESAGILSINSGDPYTSSQEVTLDFTISNATQMLLSENGDFSGASWQTYSTPKQFTLSSGEGEKTVYAKFKDAIGNTSSNYSAQIFFDPTEVYTPTLAIGDHTNYTFQEGEILSLKYPSLVFRGKTKNLEKGTWIKLYLDGKLKKSGRVKKSKRWRIRVSPKKNQIHTLQFKYFDKDGNEILSSLTYNILIDRQKPRFVDLPRKMTKNPGDTVTWTVTDNDQVKYYQYTFRGRKVKTDTNFFILPSNTPIGISRLVIRAYDRAENKAIRRVKIKVE